MTRLGLIFILLVFSIPISAHHIRGIPHYAYSKNYPEAPTFEEVRDVGNLSLRMTYYKIPGAKALDFALYIKERDSGKAFDGQVKFAICGEDEDPLKAHSALAFKNNNNIYKASWTYEKDGIYTLIARVIDGNKIIEENFKMQIGESSLNWWYLGGASAGVLLLIIAVAILKKTRMPDSGASTLNSGAAGHLPQAK